MKKRILSLAIKVITFIVTMIILFSVSNSLNVVLTNELALTQMENSNELFIAQQSYHQIIKPILVIISATVTAIFAFFIGKDLVKIFKENNKI